MATVAPMRHAHNSLVLQVSRGEKGENEKKNYHLATQLLTWHNMSHSIRGKVRKWNGKIELRKCSVTYLPLPILSMNIDGAKTGGICTAMGELSQGCRLSPLYFTHVNALLGDANSSTEPAWQHTRCHMIGRWGRFSCLCAALWLYKGHFGHIVYIHFCIL